MSVKVTGRNQIRKSPVLHKGKQADKIPDYLTSPMLARLSREIFDYPDWIYEMKIDGYRLISKVNAGKVELISRNGKIFNQKYGILAEELGSIRDNVVLDGEMVVENSKGLSDFQLLQNYGTTRKGILKYYVFDILYLNGHIITGLPLLQRKEILAEFFKKYHLKNIYNLKFQRGNGKALFDELSSKGHEGVIAKMPDSLYVPGKRTGAWMKIKSSLIQEAVICGYTLPQNSRKYFGSLILGLYENGSIRYIGNCGTGFNETSLRELYKRFRGLETGKSPFKLTPKLSWAKGKPVWIKPELVCNVKFLEWSDKRYMRAPVFMGLREDMKATEVTDESKPEISDENINPPGKREQSEKILNISGKKVKCTNLLKVYWPEEGFTKGDLIDYYLSISKFILPYIKNRPQSLNRHPDGINGESFYQKDMNVEQLPDWIRTVTLESKTSEKDTNYLICNDKATLIYMVNLGCIEINPWHSTYLKPEEPDYFMLDLDPGNISFIDVVNTALVIKEICDEIKIPCYCKTSGSSGLHIFIPVSSGYKYDQVKTFAEILAIMTHNRLPSTTSIERSIGKRKEKIYVDFLQNNSGQTIAAPYCVRPRPFATVSAPLDWKEVNHQLIPEMFNIKNMRERLNKVGDLWEPVLKKGINLGKILKSIEKMV